ncbi:phage integrase N-terminal SAM-like domain-containing protein [Hyphomicrobium sp. MC1]|uniref:phage integrase N-terminal SAM-like domain-containing protein n=1 Tax=Hyphomicrobium sp. (strain MC1) TaxID=717785 RepID=UPI0012F52894|nr:phage integrase N-terminal SAM-like domain-containing protein [Hyphomicrobium sp. MC1]
MTRPAKRSGSSNKQFRKRVPADVQRVAHGETIVFSLPKALAGDECIEVSAQIGTHVEFSLRTSDPALVKLRLSRASEHFERTIAAYREGPRRLDQKERVAIAGILYRDLAQSFEDEPGEPEIWKLVREANDRASSSPQQMERWFGPSADQLLSKLGIVADRESRTALLRDVAAAFNDAAAKLKRNAEGDFRPDPVAERFPEWKPDGGKAPRANRSSKALTPTKLLESWRQHPDQKTVTPSTLASYTAVFGKLKVFLVKRYGAEPAAASLQRDDFRAFIDMRSEEEGVSAKTINGVDLAAINSVFNWAVDQDKLTANPAIRVKRKVRKTAEGGNRKRKSLNDAEARAILKHALDYPKKASRREHQKLIAAKRWVPWLMAYTGTRVGEVAQIRKSDVLKFDGHWAIAISAEAGTVKTKSAWHVPLHPHLIDQGFIEFVEEARDGHLFLTPRPDLYRPEAKASRTKDPRGILGPLQSVKNKLAAFAREVLPDPSGPAPNHGWRHRFKAVARKCGIDLEVRNAFADHAAVSVAGEYGKDELYAAMVTALSKVPRYEVE